MLQQLLGTELPIIQAPMAGVQGSALAIAVSQAGGLGSLPCAMLDIDAMRSEIAAIRAATDKPYNVNFFCHHAPQPDAGARGTLARRPGTVLPRVRHRPGRHPGRPGPHSLQRGSGACAGRVPAAGGELPLRPAARAADGSGAQLGRQGAGVGHQRGRGALAGGARCRGGHRAGTGGGRPSRALPVARPDAPERHLRAAAAGGARGALPGHRGGRHRRRAGCRGGVCAGRRRRAAGHRLAVVSGSRHQRPCIVPRCKARPRTTRR